MFVLSDIRRDPSADDMRMLAFLNYHILPFTLLATKADKLSRMKQRERARKVAQSAGLGEDNIIAVSSLTGEGKDKLLKKIEGILSL